MPINKKEYLCLGLLAHVDAGKTTLSEALLHRTGAIRSAGRVDHGDADRYPLGATLFLPRTGRRRDIRREKDWPAG